MSNNCSTSGRFEIHSKKHGLKHRLHVRFKPEHFDPMQPLTKQLCFDGIVLFKNELLRIELFNKLVNIGEQDWG